MVESPVISIFIKSDRLRKRVPRVGEMVRLVGRPGLFLVMRVDRQNREVGLMHKAGQYEPEKNVSFNSIRTLDKDVSVAVQKFLNSRFSSPWERTNSNKQ